MRDGPTVETIELQVAQLAVNIASDLDGVCGGSKASLEHWIDYTGQRLVMSLRQSFAFETVDTQFVTYPATWWDHFKRDVLPTWVARRLRPVATSATQINTRAYYPNISLPDKSPVIRFHRVGVMPRWEEGDEIAQS